MTNPPTLPEAREAAELLPTVTEADNLVTIKLTEWLIERDYFDEDGSPEQMQRMYAFGAYCDNLVAIYRDTLARQQTDGAEDDPARILKNALFALEKQKAEPRSYGGVLTDDSKRAWIAYGLFNEGECPALSALPTDVTRRSTDVRIAISEAIDHITPGMLHSEKIDLVWCAIKPPYPTDEVRAPLKGAGEMDASDFHPCGRCGQHVHIDTLDFKPERLDRWWWYLLPESWAWKLLQSAADTGEQFEAGFCKPCYGPCYVDVWSERNAPSGEGSGNARKALSGGGEG